MELEDCAFPLLAGVKATDSAEEAFDGADWIILVGGQPRRDGQTRADLVKVNSPIFTSSGQGDQRGRRAQCPHCHCRQSVQQQLPDRAVARAQGPA